MQGRASRDRAKFWVLFRQLSLTICCSVAKSYSLCNRMDCSTPGFPVLHCLPGLLKLMSIELVMPSNYLILCPRLLLLPSIFPSIRVFPMNWLFGSGGHSIGASASNEYSGLISFRSDWFDLLAVQGTLKSLLQHHTSKASMEGGLNKVQIILWYAGLNII